MDFSVDTTHSDIREAVRALCARFPDEYWAQHDRDEEFPWDFYKAVVDGGWLGLTVPAEYGGGGLGVTEAAIVEQEIAASGAGMNGCSAVHIGIFGFESIIKHGSEDLKKRFLPRLVEGDLHVSFAVTEPDAGTDTTTISTFATKVEGGWSISGKKVWITKAQEAERLIILCRTAPREDGRKRTDGMTLFFAPMDRERVTVRKIPKLGRNAVDTNELFIDDLFVPESDVIGEVGKGFRAILAGLNAERVISANASIGIGRAALRRATTYAKDRTVFGRPIGQNQAISHPLARALVQLDAADLVCQRAAWLIDNDEPSGKDANEAKFLAAEAGFFAADAALSAHGGYGYSKEYHIERYFREARLMRIAPISQEMVLNYVAEHVLGLPRSY
ncbi:acyl-CoA dehydrogenase family protein [Saccharopolyspora sp. TS4A08]|uniref:Acyl-CoA dehydrogenase family protein n=1 Tax=Saccharopolyspora ipomoeae TaxID=3042027 RepID=A0ABT6PIB6_9PSEU|nr:acyl-CoA dehydrogenase family protein [Saccharopolyspora sp. TS4A08]MDI2027738.1 acyl-CoA dehydrogenase family protein [Saccharopolyspora sp. TS4A08]